MNHRKMTGIVLALLVAETGAVRTEQAARHVFPEPAKNREPTEVYMRSNWFSDRPVDEYLGARVPLVRDGARLWVSLAGEVDFQKARG